MLILDVSLNSNLALMTNFSNKTFNIWQAEAISQKVIFLLKYVKTLNRLCRMCLCWPPTDKWVWNHRVWGSPHVVTGIENSTGAEAVCNGEQHSSASTHHYCDMRNQQGSHIIALNYSEWKMSPLVHSSTSLFATIKTAINSWLH